LADLARRTTAINAALNAASDAITAFVTTLRSPAATTDAKNDAWHAMWEALFLGYRTAADQCEPMLDSESAFTDPEQMHAATAFIAGWDA
jgi:hypothetical protein